MRYLSPLLRIMEVVSGPQNNILKLGLQLQPNHISRDGREPSLPSMYDVCPRILALSSAGVMSEKKPYTDWQILEQLR